MATNKSQFEEGEKLFFTGTTPHLSCVVLSQTVDAGGVAGEKNAMITIQVVSTGYVMTFPIGLEDRLLRRVRTAMEVGDTGVEVTNDEQAL
jgi:hypothetical protein